ncbi:MAG TPA: hypothetical protein VL327_12270 [Pyrinomonadaceae bacterium]|jgi:DUF4097 and DUF4098 domain-containing protein YvlB|nr:hypothetical protein [Pyrinomonadaceae bacterium]
MKNSPSLVFLFVIIALSVFTVTAQKSIERSQNREFCSDNNWSNGDQVSFKELRQMTLPATGSLAVDSGQNGGIHVTGTNRSDVLVRACVQAWGASDEAAKALASSIKISEGSEIRADSSMNDSHWSVSYDISVPRNTDLKLNAHNGGISIDSVEGRLGFETMNGGVSLRNVSGDVRGRTTNGGVHVALSGGSWQGSGLDVQTTNGGVSLVIPESYAANIETGTTNGGYRSDIPSLNITTENVSGDMSHRRRGGSIKTALNGGGAPIRLVTTNGGIRISSSENASKY